MSRLDSVIRRFEAQRACLDHAVAMIGGLPGPVLEIGLGHGRTFDHLHALCPGREIFVFERQVSPKAEAKPAADHLILGDMRETLSAFAARHPRAAALLHSDIGTGDARRNAVMAEALAARLPALMRPGGIVLSDQELAYDGAERLPPPAGVAADRYFLYRAR
jgi:hypothetical protein